MADPIAADLRELAARYHLGAFLNEVDELGVKHGGANRVPATTWTATHALWRMLADLELTDAASKRAADVWRAP